jgi:hypothetical protein
MVRAIAMTVWIACLGCGRGAASSDKPKGTTSDPVEVCERFGDVCKLDGSKLGVCAAKKSGPGLVCASQH